MLELIGRLHPVFVHLPIGILLLGILFEWLSSLPSFRPVRKSIRIILWLGAISAAASALTGWLLSRTGEYDPDAVQAHQWAGIMLTLFAFLAAFIRTRRMKRWHRPLSVLLMVMVLLTGHLGGTLTHGDDYLTLRKAEAPDRYANIDLEQALYYADLVQPVLQNKCTACHGSSKQKGKLRLDAPEHILRGGRGGAVLVAGKPESSELMQRLLLPPDHEDHMPPKEKKQLTVTEREVIRLWIQSGAAFDQRVTDSGVLPSLQQLLASIQTTENLGVSETNVAPASPTSINELRKLGAVVVPVADGSNYLSVNLLNVTSLDEAMPLLTQLRDQVIWLKAGFLPVTDVHLQTIAGLNNLNRLSLEHTRITDEGLPELLKLKALVYLNLNHTNVTVSGIRSLASLQQLQSLYVYQTGVSFKEVELLKRAFPHTQLEVGNYQVHTLLSDTTQVIAGRND